jgi:hypothetical protein
VDYFSDIADFCTKEGGSIVPNEKKRATGIKTLAQDILPGIRGNDRSQVLFLNYFTKKHALIGKNQRTSLKTITIV